MVRENVAYTYNGILFNIKKKKNPAICNNVVNLGVMLSENSQTEKDKYCTESLM